MSRKRLSISKSRKMQILEESFKEGAISSEVAKKYGLRPEKLYTWRSVHKRQQGLMETKSDKIIVSQKAAGEFVEVQLDESEEFPCSKLQRVSFDFTDYVLQITGKIDDKIIGSILKISGGN